MTGVDESEEGTSAPEPPHDRSRRVVSSLRASFRTIRSAVCEAPRRAAPSSRHRQAGSGKGGRPSGSSVRRRVAGLPHPAGFRRMVEREGRPHPHGILGAGASDGPSLARPPGERLGRGRGREESTSLSRRRVLPHVLEKALASPGGRCYRHCDLPIRTRRVSSRLPGTFRIRACPSGVVSVTAYYEWTRRDPTPSVRRTLREWTIPPSLVRSWDLRLATRHGPELGRAAEQFLEKARPRRGVRVVYWRVYPFKSRSGAERRLFVCVRKAHATPVFFAASPTAKHGGCPVCAGRRRA